MKTVGSSAVASATSGKQQISRKQMAEFAGCIVKKSPANIRGALIANAKMGKLLSDKQLSADAVDCVGVVTRKYLVGALKMPGDTLPYALADALVRVDYPKSGFFDFAAKSPLDHPSPELTDPGLAGKGDLKAEQAKEDDEQILGFYYLSKFGECVVRAEPTKTHDLLLTPIASQEESAAFAAISDALGSCLPEGQVKFTRDHLRGTLALNFYRLAGAPAGAAVRHIKVTS
jgi:hypothetical protein